VNTLELSPYGELRPSITTFQLRLTGFDRYMGLLLIALISVEIVLGRVVELGGPEHPFGLLPWREIAILCAAVAFSWWRPVPRLIDAAKLLLWGSLFGCPLAYLVQLAGRSHFALMDRQLAWIDGHVHFDTASIHAWVAQTPYLATCSIMVYWLFIPLLYSAATIPCLCGHTSASRRFVVGVVIAMLLGAALFVFLPAAGPWMTETMHPSRIQEIMSDYLLRLKSGLPMNVELEHSAIVSFPSEHVVVAVLGAEALGSIRSIRNMARIMGALICITTVTTGWHYGIDVFGGLVVAYVSSVLAKRVCALWEIWDVQASTIEAFEMGNTHPEAV
jgi:membrane-associated phospholipid phosphatase